MAITGIDTIEGKQIIAAGAVSAKSAEMAYNDENGNPITGYQVAGDYYSASNPSGFITGVDLTPYQLTADMTAYQPAGDYYSASNPSGFISEVPAGTMNESAFGYDENDKISGYNGSAFAGGSDVPEGVMVESGLEYNAVNEISGYNGSAIAQYGAEKQWLVVDDTLLTLSNSAQFAIGVNISAVQQLMGIDETVLYNNTAATTADIAIGATFNISEPITNFNKVNIQFSRFSLTSQRPCAQSVVLDTTAAIPSILLHTTFTTQDTGDGNWFGCSLLISGTSGTTWKMSKCYQNTLPAGALDQGWCYLKPYKIIGIGRKQ